MPNIEINRLVIPVWLIAISLIIFLGLLGATYITGKRITWSPFGFETSSEDGGSHRTAALNVFESEWVHLREGQAKSITHGLNVMPQGFTIYFQNDDGSSDLVDLVSYNTVGGVGAMITEVTNKIFVLRGGRHNIRDRFPGTTGPDRLEVVDEGKFRVVVWAQKENTKQNE